MKRAGWVDTSLPDMRFCFDGALSAPDRLTKPALAPGTSVKTTQKTKTANVRDLDLNELPNAAA